MVTHFFLQLKRRDARNRKQPIENTRKQHEVVRGVGHAEGGDCGKGEEDGGVEGGAGEEEAF